MQSEMTTTRPIKTHFAQRGVYVFESHHAAGFQMRLDTWEFHKLCVVQQGRGQVIHEKGATSIGPGDVVFLPALFEHKFEDAPDQPLSLMMACFYDDKIMGDLPWAATVRCFEKHFPCAATFPLQDPYRITGVMNAFQMMLFEQTRQGIGWEEMVCTQLIGVMVFLMRAHAQRQALADDDPALRRFAASMALLNNEFQRPIRIEELADVAGLSYRAYTQRFKQENDLTVTQYIMRLRIDYAKQRMIESGNVLHSAMQAGFGDLAHFYRAFKRATGITPKKYLASHRHDAASGAVPAPRRRRMRN